MATEDVIQKIEKYLIDYSVNKGSIWHHVPVADPEDVKRVLNDDARQFLQKELDALAHSVRGEEKARIGDEFSKWFLDDEVTTVEDAIEKITGIQPQPSKLKKHLRSQQNNS
jgi:hypothetical protein